MQFLERIEQKNKELVKLKLTTGKTVQPGRQRPVRGLMPAEVGRGWQQTKKEPWGMPAHGHTVHRFVLENKGFQKPEGTLPPGGGPASKHFFSIQ